MESFTGSSVVRSSPSMKDTRAQSLGGKDTLENGMATHSSILALRIPWTEEPGGLSNLRDDAVKVQYSVWQQIWKTQQWPQDWKGSVFIPIPKKGNAKECSNYHTIAHISHASKVMLKSLQARLQQYVNQELPDVEAGFRKGRGTRDQIANLHWIIRKSKSSRKTSPSLTTPKPLTMWIKKSWKILKEMGIPDHLTCFLRNVNAG